MLISCQSRAGDVADNPTIDTADRYDLAGMPMKTQKHSDSKPSRFAAAAGAAANEGHAAKGRGVVTTNVC